MFTAKDFEVARAIKPGINLARLDPSAYAWLKIAQNANGGSTVYDATIENGIATFGGVVASQPLVSLLLNIPVTQTGSGTPSPTNIRDFVGVSGVNVSRTGKNLLNNPDQTITVGSYIINNVNAPMVAGYYILSFEFSGTDNSSSLRVDDENGTAIFTTSKTIRNGHNNFFINLPSNGSFVKLYSNAVGAYSKFQIEIGTEPTAYEPYTGNIYQIAFGQTVYSAILDVLTGVLSITHIRKAMSDLTWAIVTDITSGFGYDYFRSSGNIEDMNSSDFPVVSDCLVNNKHTRGELLNNEIGQYNSANYSRRLVCRADSITTIKDWNTFIADKYIVYELAEPIEIQLTPTVINTLIGENVIFADVADVTECKYTRK